jgi:trehalose 6-phosphate phosphatase
MLLASVLANTPIALFLDVDGTLLEIAPTPTAVQVPASLNNLLKCAAQQEAGAVALISGRSLVDLDRLFAPHRFTAAGQHGLERRSHSGRIWRGTVDSEQLDFARALLVQLVAHYPRLLLEDKGSTLALHYRNAPQLHEVVHTKMRELLPTLQADFRLRAGKCVLELAPAAYSKRTAIEAFMAEPPFAARVPVFVGDDVTDEDGFLAVNALGGYSIHVGKTEHTAAQFHLDDVNAVIQWLDQRYLSDSLAARTPDAHTLEKDRRV